MTFLHRLFYFFHHKMLKIHRTKILQNFPALLSIYKLLPHKFSTKKTQNFSNFFQFREFFFLNAQFAPQFLKNSQQRSERSENFHKQRTSANWVRLKGNSMLCAQHKLRHQFFLFSFLFSSFRLCKCQVVSMSNGLESFLGIFLSCFGRWKGNFWIFRGELVDNWLEYGSDFLFGTFGFLET